MFLIKGLDEALQMKILDNTQLETEETNVFSINFAERKMSSNQLPKLLFCLIEKLWRVS